MFTLPPSVRVYFSLAPADMRRSFDGLSMMVEQIIRQDPFSGHLFVFRNKRGDRIKILYWDRDGYAIWYKRLEAGAFPFPEGAGNSVVIEWDELAALLGGLDLSGAKRRKRFRRL